VAFSPGAALASPLGELKTDARGLIFDMKFIMALRGSLRPEGLSSSSCDAPGALGSLDVRALRTTRARLALWNDAVPPSVLARYETRGRTKAGVAERAAAAFIVSQR